MRTTIRLPDDLLREAKKRAAERGTTLARLFEDALREALLRERGAAAARPPVALVTVRGRGTQPGVDLEDSAALLELMESGEER
jgi:hypothetical protein